MDIRPFLEAAGVRAVSAVIEGIYTGAYEICLPGEEPKEIPDVTLTGIDENLYPAAQGELKQGISLAEAQSWQEYGECTEICFIRWTLQERSWSI